MSDKEDSQMNTSYNNEGDGDNYNGDGRGFSNFRNANSRCYNCNQTGHLSYNCQRKQNGYGYRPRGGGGGFRSQRCYNCQREGHISRECTNPPSSKACYNCGNEGHISRDCGEPRKERLRLCFHCNESGHIAAQCPTRV